MKEEGVDMSRGGGQADEGQGSEFTQSKQGRPFMLLRCNMKLVVVCVGGPDLGLCWLPGLRTPGDAATGATLRLARPPTHVWPVKPRGPLGLRLPAKSAL